MELGPDSSEYLSRRRDSRQDPNSKYYEDPNDPRVQERNRNRAMLKELHEKHHNLNSIYEADLATMRASFSDMRDTWAREHAQVRGEMQQIMQEKASLQREVLQVRNELERMRQECQQTVCRTREQAEAQSSMKREFQEAMSQFQREFQQMTGKVSDLGSMKREFQEMKSQFQREFQQVTGKMSDLGSMKREFQEMKAQFQKEFQQVTGKMSDFDRKAVELKRGLQSKDELVRLESRTGMVMQDLQALTRQLWDRGVLAPPKPEAPPEEDKPPVGMLELDEDIFTARLLLRLGYMRAEAEAHREAGTDTESDQEGMIELSHFDNVQGLMAPEVQKGETGYCIVTHGFLSVCVLTSFVQWLILGIMLTHGLTGDECFKRPPTPFKWWLLHLSKAFAMAITGILMGKEIMGILNYFLVSELLEPRRSLEVMLTTLVQGGLTTLLVASNVFIFLGLTNPVDVWTNMAALGFIASLDAEVLTVTKGGILGHHMAKSITPLNYQLTFMSYYPAWFSYVRGVAVLVVAGFISCLSAMVFFMPDPVCAEEAS